MAIFHPPAPGQPLVRVEPAHEATVAQIDRDALVAQYQAHGALLLRGFGVTLDQFGDLGRSLCRTAVINESPGRDVLDPDRGIYAVNGGTEPFALHPELSREPWKPDLAMFACLGEPARGGMTTLCDGIALARALPTAIRDGLAGRRLVYANPTWPGLLAYWLGTAEPDDALLAAPPAQCPYQFRRMRDGRIVRLFSRPALHRPMFADDLAFGNFLLFARFNNGRHDFPLLDDLTPVPEAWLQAIRATGDALSLAVPWQRGDLLILDNTRFMHGRTAVEDPAERRIATWFGYVDFARPDPEEPADPIWRRIDFAPPAPPQAG